MNTKERARQILALMTLNPEHALEIIEGLLERVDTLEDATGRLTDAVTNENG